MAVRKSLEQLVFDAVGQTKKITRGQLEIPKGKACGDIRLHFTVVLANDSGGNAALTKAQQRSYLSGWEFSLSYGPGNKLKPYASVDGADMRNVQRELCGFDVEGYGDTSTGLEKTVNNGATGTCVFAIRIPTGRDFKVPGWKRRGMGPSQCRTVILEVKRAADTLPTGWTVDTDPVVEVYTTEYSAKGDQFVVLPQFEDQVVRGKRFYLEDGLPRLVAERTAAHASTAFTEFNSRVDEEVVCDQTEPAQFVQDYRDDELLSSEMDISDIYTLLHVLPREIADKKDILTGRFFFEQPQGDQDDIDYLALRYPILSEDQWKAILKEVSTDIREKDIRMVAHYALHNLAAAGVPDRFQPYEGYTFFDSDDAEYEQFPGLWGSPHAEPVPYVPISIKNRVQEGKKQAEANGEMKAAKRILRRNAMAIPGAVQSGRGSARPSATMGQFAAVIDS
jgi:hypothetical protein